MPESATFGAINYNFVGFDISNKACKGWRKHYNTFVFIVKNP